MVRRITESFVSVDLDYLLKTNGLKDTLVLYVGNEDSNFHKIEMASGKSEHVLGWTTNELKGQDLSLLLPNGIKRTHAYFFKKKSYFGGRLENDFKIKAYCRNSSGNLLHCELYIKLAYFEDMGLQFMGMLIFNKVVSDDDACSLLLDREG